MNVNNGFMINTNMIYIVSFQHDKPLKIISNDIISSSVDPDNTHTIKKQIHPEELFEIDSKLYMKWKGSYYALEQIKE